MKLPGSVRLNSRALSVFCLRSQSAFCTSLPGFSMTMTVLAFLSPTKCWGSPSVETEMQEESAFAPLSSRPSYTSVKSILMRSSNVMI